jgi:hypothetical protein
MAFSLRIEGRILRVLNLKGYLNGPEKYWLCRGSYHDGDKCKEVLES